MDRFNDPPRGPRALLFSEGYASHSTSHNVSGSLTAITSDALRKPPLKKVVPEAVFYKAWMPVRLERILGESQKYYNSLNGQLEIKLSF